MKFRTLAAGTAAAGVLLLGACSSGGTSSGSAVTAARPTPALTAEQVATRMGIGSLKAYTAATDPNHLLGRQGEYTSKVNWSAGSIEVFPTAADASARQAYVQAFKCPFGDGHDYLDGVYLLRLGCSLTPVQAKENEGLLRKAVSGGPTPAAAAPASSAGASSNQSRALTATDKIICAYHAQGMTPAQIFTALYTAPESAAQVKDIISTALAAC